MEAHAEENAEGKEGGEGDEQGTGGALAASNVTLLPDHMIGEIFARSHDNDLLAVISTCKVFGRIQRLDAKREVSFPPDTHIVKSLALVEWAVGNGWPWPTKDERGRQDRFAACKLVAGGGCVAVLQRARADGYEWGSDVCAAAAKGGHLAMLTWLHANGCPWDEETCWEAAWGGHLEVLKWLRANGCPWNEETLNAAEQSRRRGGWRILEWARANGCPEYGSEL